jgi:hypothetical protein
MPGGIDVGVGGDEQLSRSGLWEVAVGLLNVVEQDEPGDPLLVEVACVQAEEVPGVGASEDDFGRLGSTVGKEV